MSEMRTWRTDEYGQLLDVLHLDTVPVPEPEAGEVRVRVQGLSRLWGGAVRHHPGGQAQSSGGAGLPLSPGESSMQLVHENLRALPEHLRLLLQLLECDVARMAVHLDPLQLDQICELAELRSADLEVQFQ
jgi:hypothetical protein